MSAMNPSAAMARIIVSFSATVYFVYSSLSVTSSFIRCHKVPACCLVSEDDIVNQATVADAMAIYQLSISAVS